MRQIILSLSVDLVIILVVYQCFIFSNCVIDCFVTILLDCLVSCFL